MSFGCDSEAGSRFAERLLTVAARCRQQGRALPDLLVAAGEAALLGTAPPSLVAIGQGGLNAYRPPYHLRPRDPGGRALIWRRVDGGPGTAVRHRRASAERC